MSHPLIRVSALVRNAGGTGATTNAGKELETARAASSALEAQLSEILERSRGADPGKAPRLRSPRAA
jgi:hypothetical protein